MNSFRQKITGKRLTVIALAYRLLPIASCLLPVACSLLLILILCIPPLSSSAFAEKTQQVGMRFENISLLDFVNFVSEYTGTNIVYDPSHLRGNVTIKARREFSKKGLLKILNAVLRMNNLEMTTENGITYIVNRRGILKLPSPYTEKEKIQENRLSVTVFQVEHIDAKALSSFLNIMKSDIGRFVVIPNINTVIVKDKGENLKNISKIINILSTMGKEVQIEIFPLKYTQASEFINSIKSFFIGLNKLHYSKVMPVFMADRSSNSVVVAAMPEDMAIIKRIITKVDVVQETATRPRVFKLKYARAEDVEKILNKILSEMTPRPGKGKVPLLKKTIVAADKATNTISVVGDPEVYARVESLIEKLDIPRDQIFVEALIIETTLEEGAKFGVEWLAGAGDKNTAGAATFLNTGDLVNFSSPVLEGKPPNLSALPGGFSLGILGNVITYEGVKFPTLTALVNAIKSKSGINILSKPQLLTLDNEEAEVFVGENRPFLISEKFDANNNPIQTFDYRDVGIKLKILPHVVDNDTILLNIKEEVKKVIATATGVASAPITLTRSTNTTVKLKNNMTVVISGLIKNDNSITETKVPILSDIPILGWLFRSKDKTVEKTNMMVFITTRIIRTRGNMEELTREKQKAVGYNQQMNPSYDGNERDEGIEKQSSEDENTKVVDATDARDRKEQAESPDRVEKGKDIELDYDLARIDSLPDSPESFENPFFSNAETSENIPENIADKEISTETDIITSHKADTRENSPEKPGYSNRDYRNKPFRLNPEEKIQNRLAVKASRQKETLLRADNKQAESSAEMPPVPVKKQYAIQVGFFRSLENANNLYHDLTDKGYQTIIREDSRKKGYRVLVGTFNALLDAISMKEQLQKEGLDTLIYSY
ncbi:MAG: type II secretion system secretin GspD [Nitrospirae bacterium]|nr:type II secretion system secretin GspD [Nitrospirota bacterium]